MASDVIERATRVFWGPDYTVMHGTFGRESMTAAIRVVLEDMAASEARIPSYPIDVASYAFSLGIRLTKPEEADNDRS